MRPTSPTMATACLAGGCSGRGGIHWLRKSRYRRLHCNITWFYGQSRKLSLDYSGTCGRSDRSLNLSTCFWMKRDRQCCDTEENGPSQKRGRALSGEGSVGCRGGGYGRARSPFLVGG